MAATLSKGALPEFIEACVSQHAKENVLIGFVRRSQMAERRTSNRGWNLACIRPAWELGYGCSNGNRPRRRLQSGPAGITAGRNRRNDRKGAFAPGGSSKRGPIYELAVLRLLKERNAVAQEIVGRTFRIYRT